MNGFRLWDVEKTESVTLEDAHESEETLFIVTLPASLLQPDGMARSDVRAHRIVDAEFALLEMTDGTTTLVERISEPVPVSEQDQSRLRIEYLTVG